MPSPNPDQNSVIVKRALLSVSDKTGLEPFARALVNEFGCELLSTGGTAEALRNAGLPVRDVSDITQSPEIMDGRVKTLHPRIHGGLLARLPQDEAVLAGQGIEPIDLLCVNLYPFAETVAKQGVTDAEAVENIDIGGPAMIRAAAKNHERVTVVMRADEYMPLLDEMRANGGATTHATRRRLAGDAFGYCSDYDRRITDYLLTKPPSRDTQYTQLRSATSPLDDPGDGVNGEWKLRQPLRYGENPHQRAALFIRVDDTEEKQGEAGTVAGARQLHGKELGYINLLDADAALSVVREFAEPACCIVKHATPCGVGIGESLAIAFEHAHVSDPLAAFGGIVAFNQPVDAETAGRLAEGKKFLEVILAPRFEPAALAALRERWTNVRLLETGPLSEPVREDRLLFHPISGGLLLQERDLVGLVDEEWNVVSERQPTDDELAAMRFNWLACKHVKSNAIVIGGRQGTYGIGGGQVDRVAAANQAIGKAGDRSGGAVAASDAFFPFSDGPEALLDAGVTALVQPGGSRNDRMTIDLVNEREAAMIFTGRRHFRH
jgi:phosphoribosylaminoimidazolecarboxamide formyltransferase/IMP cyclohydrolase